MTTFPTPDQIRKVLQDLGASNDIIDFTINATNHFAGHAALQQERADRLQTELENAQIGVNQNTLSDADHYLKSLIIIGITENIEVDKAAKTLRSINTAVVNAGGDTPELQALLDTLQTETLELARKIKENVADFGQHTLEKDTTAANKIVNSGMRNLAEALKNQKGYVPGECRCERCVRRREMEARGIQVNEDGQVTELNLNDAADYLTAKTMEALRDAGVVSEPCSHKQETTH